MDAETHGHRVGTVGALWRFPVKSMLGERVDAVVVTRSGVVGDRAFGLIDGETGKIASAKNPRRWGNLLKLRAEYVENPEHDDRLPPVRITLPDATVMYHTDPNIDEALSEAVGRPVRLTSEPPARRVLENYHPDIDELPESERDTVTDSDMGVFAPNTFQDAAPLQLMSTATLARLTELRRQTAFDARRFRPNFVVATEETSVGFVENDWAGQTIALGPDVRAQGIISVPRCVITTLDQQELPRDNAVLQTIARHNRIDIPILGPSPCAGLYAIVASGGTVRRGDQVAIAQ
jgi:uncharacterized protein YcbX